MIRSNKEKENALCLAKFFLFWVRLWVKAINPPQKLRRNKTKKGPGPYKEIRKGKFRFVPCPEQLIRRLEVKGERFYPPMGGASRAPGLPQAAAGAFAGVARTHSEMRDRRPQEGTCRGCVSPVCRFQSEDGGGPHAEGTWTALGRVWGGGCLGQVMTR